MLFSPFQWFKKGTSTMVLITSTATWRPCLNPEDQSLPDRKDASSRPPPTPSFSLVCVALAGHVTMQRNIPCCNPPASSALHRGQHRPASGQVLPSLSPYSGFC